MPPAPTSPRTDASRMFTSKRYSTAEGQRREQLGEHGVPDAEQEGGDAHGLQGVIGPEVQRLNGLREPLAQKAHAANAQGKHAGKGAGTGYPNKDQAVDQKGDRADRHDDHPEQQRRELVASGRGREEGQGTAITVPAQVPTRAMHTVSSSRSPKPLVSVSKKKAQSGWNRPEIMACTARGLIWEKSGGWRDTDQN